MVFKKNTELEDVFLKQNEGHPRDLRKHRIFELDGVANVIAIFFEHFVLPFVHPARDQPSVFLQMLREMEQPMEFRRHVISAKCVSI